MTMSKTVPVSFAGRWFWAYDVSLGILLLKAIEAASEPPTDPLLAPLRAQIDLIAGFLAQTGMTLEPEPMIKQTSAFQPLY